METQARKRIMFAVIAAAILLFIWGQSTLPVKSSSAESGWLRSRIINPLLQLVGLGPVSSRAVRKAAHVAEFFALSLFTSLFFRGSALRAVPIGLAAAFLDETIQLFSDRSGQVQDVWIDLIGVAFGAALGWLLTRRGRKRKT